jgi:hypothetical protein
MRKFMRDLNMADDTINQCALEALRLNDSSTSTITSIVPKFDERALPLESEPIIDWANKSSALIDKLAPVIKYLTDRNLYLEDYPFYWTPKVGFSNRIIIPFYFEGKVVGYTARAINDAKPKYISEQQPGYVFNLDRQTTDRAFVIVCEGPIDAISIDACAIMGAEIKDSQNWLLKQLGREIVLVPDKDHEGPKTVEQAIEFGWSVSMPDWPAGIKDVNDAVVKYGKLMTLLSILQTATTSKIKIELQRKKIGKQNGF